MNKVFKNSKNQVRSGWKIAGVMALYFLIVLVLQIISGIVAVIFMAGKVPMDKLAAAVTDYMTKSSVGMLISQGLDFAALLIALILVIKVMEKKKFKDYGLTAVNRNYKDLVWGLLLGIVSMTIIFVILLATKNIELQDSLLKPKFSGYTVSGLVLFIIVAFKEEFLSRGYSITVLNQMNRPWLSIVLSSIMFSAMHFLNPNVKVLGLVNIVLVGVLFGYMFVKTKNLWMPIGYHLTWNYFQGNIFGFAVSGTDPHGIYTISTVKDNILTGGAFGPEAGILTTIVIVLGVLIVWRFHKSEQFYEEKSNFHGMI